MFNFVCDDVSLQLAWQFPSQALPCGDCVESSAALKPFDVIGTPQDHFIVEDQWPADAQTSVCSHVRASGGEKKDKLIEQNGKNQQLFWET